MNAVWIIGRQETDSKIGEVDDTVLFVLNFVADIHLGCVVWHALRENVLSSIQKRVNCANQVEQKDCSVKNLPQSCFSLWLDKHLAYGVVTWYAGLRQNCLSGVQMLKGMTMWADCVSVWFPLVGKYNKETKKVVFLKRWFPTREIIIIYN